MTIRYLVTGGAGFIGSHIVEELLAQDNAVTVFDDFSTGKRANLQPFLRHPGLTIVTGDLRNREEVFAAMRGIDFVLHQGALPSVPRSIQDPLASDMVNVVGTLNVLDAAREYGVKRVVYASSSSVYGNSPALPKIETMPVQPLSPYAVTKFAAERYTQLYYTLYGLETVCLRYFNVFGPRQDPFSQYSAVIPKFIAAMKEGRQPVIFGDGTHSRDFTFVKNNVRANLLACHASGAAGEVFNIACGGKYTLVELVDCLNRILNTVIEPQFLSDRPGDVKHSMADIEKARRILGYNPTIDFYTGLEATVRSFTATAPPGNS